MKNESGLDSHEWPWKSPMPSVVSSQLTRPYCVSKIHCQTTVADSGGIAQASSSADADQQPHAPAEALAAAARSACRCTIVSTTLTSAEDDRAPQHRPELVVAQDRRVVVEPDPARPARRTAGAARTPGATAPPAAPAGSRASTPSTSDGGSEQDVGQPAARRRARRGPGAAACSRVDRSGHAWSSCQPCVRHVDGRHRRLTSGPGSPLASR